MSCYFPIKAFLYETLEPDMTRKRHIAFKAEKIPYDHVSMEEIQIPCGKCIGCRLDHAREWAVRCQLEAQTHDFSSFITLTYRDEDLPPGGKLRRRDVQLFLKRFRKKIEPARIRYFGCGEYGLKTHRPHYHLIIFGWNFPDKYGFFVNRYGQVVWRSPLLEECWGHGHCSVGQLSFSSASYVARYALKKVLDPTGDNGFSMASNRPGIGYDWWQTYKESAKAIDGVRLADKTYSMPRYFDKLWEREDPEDFYATKQERMEKMKAIEYARLDQRKEDRDRKAVQILRSTLAEVIDNYYNEVGRNLREALETEGVSEDILSKIPSEMEDGASEAFLDIWAQWAQEPPIQLYSKPRHVIGRSKEFVDYCRRIFEMLYCDALQVASLNSSAQFRRRQELAAKVRQNLVFSYSRFYEEAYRDPPKEGDSSMVSCLKHMVEHPSDERARLASLVETTPLEVSALADDDREVFGFYGLGEPASRFFREELGQKAIL